MFGLKLFKRGSRHSAPAVQVPLRASNVASPISRLTSPPPPPPPGAFASFASPAAVAPPEPLVSPVTSAFPQPDPFAPISTPTGGAQSDLIPAPAVVAPDPASQPGEPGQARVRFFYEDGSVSEADPGESERLGYLANNLLEASRDDQS